MHVITKSTSWDRRQFLRLLGGAGAFIASPSVLRAAVPESITVSILHTTDLHSHILPTTNYQGVTDLGGFARCATQIRHWRKQFPNHMLIDVGDVYQGTHAGLLAQGRYMIDIFNMLQYDGWVIGNHEFDWGMDPLTEALARSDMPILSANAMTLGKPAGTLDDEDHPFAHIKPYILKEVAGFKIGIIGLTTPGIPYWFHPSLHQGLEFIDPVEAARNAIRELKAQDTDVILFAGHMGLRRGGDDFANRVESLAQAFPDVTAYMGGHTHQDTPNANVHGMTFTQASYHGIHCGRLDLIFNKKTRELMWVQPMTSLMDARFELDPAVIARTHEELETSQDLLETPVGVLGATLNIESQPGTPSELEELIGASIMEGMARRKIPVDGVIHGLLFADGAFEAGTKTLADMWKVIPFENQVVTAKLNRNELKTILEEVYTNWSKRSIMGMQANVSGRGKSLTVDEIRTADGKPLHATKRYTIAFNSFDAQSGGHRFLALREILQQSSSETQLHSAQTRDLLIEYFKERDAVMPVAIAA